MSCSLDERTVDAVTAEWIAGSADELAASEGCRFDPEAGQLVCDFIETLCCQSQGRWVGRPIELLDWQRDFIMRLFGWKRADGLRRYRRAYLEVAKKNGKSTMLSALVLYLLLGDAEGSPKVYLNACDKEQASIIFDEAVRMVKASPELVGRLKIINSISNKRIVHPEDSGVIIANSSIAASKDGLNAHGIIFDELHRQPDRRLVEVFEYASEAREQPLWIDITTAGEDDTGVWYEQREYSEKVNRGEIPDTTHLGVVYRADPADDIEDPATWRKANPSLGVILKEDDFRRKLEQAKETPVKLANFKRLRLNIVCSEAEKFLPPGAWKALGLNRDVLEAEMRVDRQEGRPCYMGTDLSSINDLTAHATLSGDAEDGLHLRMRFWLPEENIVELEKKHKAPYRTWAEQGWIELTPGNVIDYEFVRAEVVASAAEANLRKILVDPYNATMLVTSLKEEDDLPVEYLRQGFLSLSGPTKELERLVLSGKLRHDGNPVMTWMAGNAIAEQDAAGNVKLSKKKSRLKIDGMSALVNAIAGMLSGEGDASPYTADRGPIWASV